MAAFKTFGRMIQKFNVMPLSTTLRLFTLGVSSAFFLLILTLNIFTHRDEQILYTQLLRTNAWVAWQLEREYHRFTGSVMAFGGGLNDTDHDELTLRFEILLSRIPIVLFGAESALLRSFVGDFEVAEELEEVLHRLEPRIEAMQRGDSEAATQLLEMLSVFEKRLVQLSSRAILGPESGAIRLKLAATQARNYWLFVTLAGSALLLICQLVFEAILSWRAAAREREMREQSRRLDLENRRLNERIGSFVAVAPVGFYVIVLGEIGTQQQYASEFFIEIAGSLPADLFPTRRFLSRVPRVDRKKVVESLRSLMRNGKVQLEHRFKHSNGEVVWLSHALSLVGGTGARSWEIVGVVSDINDRKLADLAIQQGAKMMMLGEMATGLAHEMNQPLTVIRMSAENAMAVLDRQNSTAQVRTKLERISAQTVRAAKMIDQLRIFGRAPVPDFEWFSLKDAITVALDLMHEQLRIAGIRLQLQPVDDRLRVRGLQQQLEQVIINIILNAYDAFAGNQQVVRENKISVRVSVNESSQRVRVEIADNAGGIASTVIEKLFTPFVSTKPVGKGTGLGLWLTLGFVTKMGGSITAANASDGACFQIELPVVCRSTCSDP